ncbi:MAG: insulinase family protein [Deltaproteobacteria bacterium]|nr:insulinase family protein [Deltaproteobacteria bacterium]
MKTPWIVSLLLVLCCAPANAGDLQIPCRVHVLDNGLTVILHEDHKAPIVAVNVWYHVGSKNESPGRTGLAHLFEHLMFNGSAHFDDDWFQALERVGATDLNGTTSEDRTNYFQNVPAPALDLVLWMESDRMGHLLDAVTQEKLEEQRGVVQNEKRQGENEPYGRVDEAIARTAFPAGHPYSWTVIGSMEDLEAASLEDVHTWFRTWYGPGNAVLVVAGDIDPDAALARVEHFFGDIPPGPPVTRPQAWIARRTGTTRLVMEDRVPTARIYKVWNIPGWGTPEATALDLVSDILALGKSSRLYHRLVYRDQIATDVLAGLDPRELAGLFYVVATVKPGADPAAVEAALDEELARLLEEGPTRHETDRARTQWLARFLRGIERIGGFGGKSDVLAQGMVYAGDPGHHRILVEQVRQARPAGLRATARAWLGDGQLVLTVLPFPERAAAAAGADRSRLPTPGEPPDVRFPAVERGTLPNGLEVVLARRPGSPVMEAAVLVRAGYAADADGLAGTASLTLDLMDEGTRRRNALEIDEALAALGAQLSSSAEVDSSRLALSALRETWGPALEILAEVLREPAFPEEEFRRLQAETLAGIPLEEARPALLALRLLPRLLYGKDHPYGMPLTGTGTVESVGRITREDLRRFHATWFRPNNAVLVVVGDLGMEELLEDAEASLGAWAPGDLPAPAPAAPPAPAAGIYLVDRPGAEQSFLLAGRLGPPLPDPADPALEAFNEALGGAFTSRINMNLREDKHWSYGARSVLLDTRGPRPWLVFTSVQADRTREALVELHREMADVLGPRPVTTEELAKVQSGLTLGLPGTWETAAAVAGSLVRMVAFGLPDDHFVTWPGRLRALVPGDLTRAAATVLDPDRTVWVVVGDRDKVLPTLEGAVPGEVRVIRSDGSPDPAKSESTSGSAR